MITEKKPINSDGYFWCGECGRESQNPSFCGASNCPYKKTNCSIETDQRVDKILDELVAQAQELNMGY